MDIFPPDLERRLTALAMATGRTRGAIVREAVTEYVDEIGAVGALLDRRLSDLEDGRVDTIDGEDAFERLMARPREHDRQT